MGELESILKKESRIVPPGKAFKSRMTFYNVKNVTFDNKVYPDVGNPYPLRTDEIDPATLRADSDPRGGRRKNQKKGGNLREDMDSKRAKKKKKDKRRPRSGSEDSEDDYHPPSADPDEEVLPVTDGDEPEEEPPTPEEDSSDTGTDRSEADSTSVPAVTETIAPGKSIEGDGENVASGGAPEQDFRVPGVMLRERRKRSVQRSNRQTTTRALYNNPQHESMEAEVAVIIVVALVIVAVLTMLLTSGTPPPLLPATKLTPSVVNSRPAPQLLRPPVEMPHTSAHANNGKHKMGQGTATPVTIAGQTPVPLGQIKR